MFLDSTSTQIGHGDTWKEIGDILGRYNDGIAIRNVDWDIGNKYLRAVAEASRTPVLNMQCDHFHPFQVLARPSEFIGLGTGGDKKPVIGKGFPGGQQHRFFIGVYRLHKGPF